MVRKPDVSPEGDDRRLRILSTASRMMSERGFDGVSMQAIADEAGVNKALIFYYFGNKSQLFEQIFEHHLGGLHAMLQEAVEGAGDLHRVIDAFVDYIEAHPSYPRLVQRELANAQGRHDLLATHNARNYELVAPAFEGLELHGPASGEQLFISMVGMVLYYHLAAPVMAPLIGDPLGAEALAARRAHLHWMLDGLLARVA